MHTPLPPLAAAAAAAAALAGNVCSPGVAGADVAEDVAMISAAIKDPVVKELVAIRGIPVQDAEAAVRATRAAAAAESADLVGATTLALQHYLSSCFIATDTSSGSAAAAAATVSSTSTSPQAEAWQGERKEEAEALAAILAEQFDCRNSSVWQVDVGDRGLPGGMLEFRFPPSGCSYPAAGCTAPLVVAVVRDGSSRADQLQLTKRLTKEAARLCSESFGPIVYELVSMLESGDFADVLGGGARRAGGGSGGGVVEATNKKKTPRVRGAGKHRRPRPRAAQAGHDARAAAAKKKKDVVTSEVGI